MYTQEDIDEAKQILKDSGYAIDNLWSIHDVQAINRDIDDDEALFIMNKVLSNPYLKETINTNIKETLYDKNLNYE